MIRPIDKKSVHRICSGQVVLTLGVAIKELVENSLDAGATHIDIKLKEHGTALIQVSDNGSGIAEGDYEGLTLKHHTSKIRDFDDLPGVETFGFRGEALSSLCAVSDICIHTRDSQSSVGMKLEYDSNGRIKRRQALPRGQQGTTISVSNLFVPLPVRRKEFERNAKREMGRAIQLITSYCLIHPNVRFSITHQDSKSNSNLLSTDGRGSSPRDCFASVFGPRVLQQILEIEAVDELPEEIAEEFRIKTLVSEHKVSGWISSPSHGLGRSSPDRQFLFINKRPCEVQRVTRLVNEVYRELNRHQYPFLLLDIVMSRNEVDVNVTPDKRSIFFDKESHLLALIKACVKKTLKHATPIVPSIPKTSESSPSESIFSLLKRRVEEKKLNPSAKQQRLDFSSLPRSSPFSGLSQCQNKSKSFLVTPDGDHSSTPAMQIMRTPNDQPMDTDDSDFQVTKIEKEKDMALNPDAENIPQFAKMEINDSDLQITKIIKEKCKVESVSQVSNKANEDDRIFPSAPKLSLETDEHPEALKITEDSSSHEDRASIEITDRNIGIEEMRSESQVSRMDGDDNAEEAESAALLKGVMDDEENVGKDEAPHKESEQFYGNRSVSTAVKFCVRDLRQRLMHRPERQDEDLDGRKFLAKIDPTDNSQAEEELQRHLEKSDFVKMEVIGQFNIGFIVAQLNNDLFIIDQHATDEKFNFERLQREHVMEYQRLIRPQTLELSAPQEMVVLENLNVFEKNGFRFTINEDLPAGRKIDLVSTPVSRNWDFGVSDIEEMIFIMEETQTTNCRPSKVRRMLASRACRTSVMIGTALTAKEMKRLVNHMAEMDVPWSCPHGRPTIRHLGNLPLLRLAANGN